MRKSNYITIIDATVGGIPCQVGVVDYTYAKGSYSYNAPSDVDYYGYTQCEWELLDRRGYRAKWLDYKLDDDTVCEIENKIAREIQQESWDYI